MMAELLPCPFCGSGWLYETRRVGYCDDTPTMFCNSCKAVVTWEQVEEEGVNDETKAFVREHWNTRVDYRGYEQAAIDAWKCVKAYQERTCKNDIDGDEEDFACSECRARLYIRLNGDYTMILKDETLVTMPNYCPNCGAKVIGSDAE